MPLITAGSGLAGAGILAGAGLLGSAINGANSISEGSSLNDSSYGYSGNSYGYSDSGSDSWSRVYGSEASAKDILRAKEANLQQEAFLLSQQEYNAKQAEIARAWQEYMSNTSYQRAVIDLAKAGLNPILAAGNYGASTPMGAVAQSGLATAHKATTYPDQESGGSSYSHSENESSESGGGSSHGESSNYSKSEQQATSIAKGAIGVAKTIMNTLVKGVENAYAGGSGKSAYDHYDNPTNY